MGHRKCEISVENRKFLWFIGLVLASVLLLQYFELPYGRVMSNFFSAGKNYSQFTGKDRVDGAANFSVAVDQTSSYPMNHSASEKNGGSAASDKIHEDRTSEVELSFGDLYHNLTFSTGKRNNSVEIGKEREVEYGFSAKHVNTSITSASGGSQVDDIALSEEMRKPNDSIVSGNAALAPRLSVQQDDSARHTKRYKKAAPSIKKTTKTTERTVVTIREMNYMFQSHTSSPPNSTILPSSARDQQLLKARLEIEKVETVKDKSGLYAPIYWNLSRFERSYELMEQTLKIYIYKEGKRPVFHQPRLTGIYASEGWFMKLLQGSKQYVTTNPEEALLFYFPFSSQILGEIVYVPNSHSFDNLKQYLRNYLDMIKARYSFWNRTSGADHFLVACHDWAPEETKILMANCIRALCNADMKEGFQLGKDVSLPETYMHSARISTRGLGGKPPSQRQILAFFAGNMHGYVRPLLLQHWENKDPDMRIVGRLRKDSYIQQMMSSKFCICARGYEVNSPRLVEAIMYGCVPVIISDNYVPPFLEVLNWEKFSIFVLEKDIPNLKTILLSISQRRYLMMQHRVKQVRQHFLWHQSPVKYDIFHMILHSIWYNRVFQVKP